MTARPAFYPYCDNGHIVRVHDNGNPCATCTEAALPPAPAATPPSGVLMLDGRPFVIPTEPELTHEHASWIVNGVMAGEYDAPGLPVMNGARVLDIGAHCGAFVRWAESRWTGLTVDCYEPNAAACALIAQNAPDALVHNVAVTVDPAPRFGLPPDWGSAKTHGLGSDEGVEVAAIHPKDLPPADVLKCDAEGVEVEVLTNYPHWDGLQVLMYEYHSLEHRDLLQAIASGHGFRCLREQADGTYGSSIWVRAGVPTFVAKQFAGRTFLAVEPPSLGFEGHSTVCFDEHEPILAELEKIQPGDLFIDIGAQFGSYALPALAMGARVIAFEPTDYASESLKASIEKNGWSDRGIVARAALYNGTEYPKALHDEVFGTHYPSDGHSETTLDDALEFLDDETAVRWIKIDVEGAELGVLEGARTTLDRWHPTLLIEDHDGINKGNACVVSDYPESIDSSRRIHTMLAELGYAIAVVPFDVSRKYIVATHSAEAS